MWCSEAIFSNAYDLGLVFFMKWVASDPSVPFLYCWNQRFLILPPEYNPD